MSLDNPEDPLLSLASKLALSNNDPGEVHPCPTCGGELHVYFASYKRGARTMLGVHLHCHNCGKRAYVDDEYLPPWLKEPDPSNQDSKNVVRQMREWFMSKDKDELSG